MKLKFRNKKISGILSVVPKHFVKFSDEVANYGFSEEKSQRLKEIIGFHKRHIVEGNECASDLCLFGLEYLFHKNLLKKEEIHGLIFISQTPDHIMPPTSSILHGKLDLERKVFCLDINQGCAGYLYGLLQAFMLLQTSDELRKIILLNGDTLSRCSCPSDRNVYPLIGDAGTITVVENTDDECELFMNLRTDGKRSDLLIIQAGGFRTPSTEQTREIKVFPDGNKRSDEHFYMNGSEVFNFTQTDVPQAIKDLFEFSSMSMKDIDFFMFHQPNRFILEKLANKLDVPKEKMPSNIVEKFGNPSSASIPVNICYNIGSLLLEKKLKVCMSGFGVGLSWGALNLELGPMEFCELIEK